MSIIIDSSDSEDAKAIVLESDYSDGWEPELVLKLIKNKNVRTETKPKPKRAKKQSAKPDAIELLDSEDETDDYIVPKPKRKIVKRRPTKSDTKKITSESNPSEKVVLPKSVVTNGSKEKVAKSSVKPKRKCVRKQTKNTNSIATIVDDIKENVDSTVLGHLPSNLKARTVKSGPTYEHPWSIAELLTELEHLDRPVAQNVIRLFEQENTIPFIARYRKELTGQMSPEKLRDVRECYDSILAIQHRANSIIKIIDKQGKLTKTVERSVLSARSLNELEHIYTPYKPTSRRTLAERARMLGLEEPALNILAGRGIVDIASLVDVNKEGLSSVVEVLHGIQHIIAEVVSKEPAVLDTLRQLYQSERLIIESSLLKLSKSDTGKDKPKTSKAKGKTTNTKMAKNVDPNKFQSYFDYKIPVNQIKPYQMLAINRGENLKILSVKVNVPESIHNNLVRFCERFWLRQGQQYSMRQKLLVDAVNDAYKRLLNPLMVRQTRTGLNKLAIRASVEVFSSNLKQLLLTQPVKGSKILGIDPGYTNGCKMALISERGEVLETAVVYPHSGRNNQCSSTTTICNMLYEHTCSLIALGNGTACRETEIWLGNLINQKQFPPGTRYSIVNERGASIYSCSEDARKEFPKMDPNLISAVFLARCLQDPLCEFVRVEPKHLGVGMYQHDIPDKLLTSALTEVVVECVSFVGVDLNTASVVLLRQVAGMSTAKAEKVIAYRNKNGPFCARERLKDIPGMGPKSYEQCAGFIRIVPETAGTAVYPLDATWVHPESYNIAERIINAADARLGDLGTEYFIKKIQKYAKEVPVRLIADQMNVMEERVSSVIEALCRNPQKDYRCDKQKNEPLFKHGVMKITDLKAGTTLTGKVTNVTHFGSFVDIGIGCDGLIHQSTLRGQSISLGDRVVVLVQNVDLPRNRVSLNLQSIL